MLLLSNNHEVQNKLIVCLGFYICINSNNRLHKYLVYLIGDLGLEIGNNIGCMDNELLHVLFLQVDSKYSLLFL